VVVGNLERPHAVAEKALRSEPSTLETAEMKKPVSDVAFTPRVKSVQERLGSRASYADQEERGGWQSRVTPELAAFLAERDSFYLGTASADSQPYVQHRGGPRGFLKVLDERTLAFADFSGNRQYISMGNLEENSKAFIFLMDYPNRRRVKLWGRVEVRENDERLLETLADLSYQAKPERVFVFHVEAWDVNCRQHIIPRFSEEEMGPRIRELQERVAELEAELRHLRASAES